MRKRSDAEVFRITAARRGLDEDVRTRQRRYVIAMSVRTVSVILAATLWDVERHVAVVALVLGLLLPYIAVVFANAGRENAVSLPSTYLTTPSRPVLEKGPGVDKAEGEPEAPVPGPPGAEGPSGSRPRGPGPA